MAALSRRACAACRMTRGCAAELAARGLARVRAAFTQEQIARQTLDVYREVLGQ